MSEDEPYLNVYFSGYLHLLFCIYCVHQTTNRCIKVMLVRNLMLLSSFFASKCFDYEKITQVICLIHIVADGDYK